MCIGNPMQVVSCDEHSALCEADGEQQQVDISLLGPQPKGTWLLVFLGAAREVMTPEQALKTRTALNALQRVMQGSNQVDDLFSDLIDREPQLPPHLHAQLKTITPPRTTEE
jgi:hydrogenase expression/formation protein HypC